MGQIGQPGQKGDIGPAGHLENVNLLVSCKFADASDNKKSLRSASFCGACVTSPVPSMENDAASDFCMEHQTRLCTGRLLFSFCSTLPTPQPGATEGQRGRKMETEKKTEICGRASSETPPRVRHFTRAVRGHGGYITFTAVMETVWIDAGSSATIVCHCYTWKADDV